MTRTVYYVIDAHNRVPLHSASPQVTLHDSYRRFQNGATSTGGFKNYQGYLNQILPFLTNANEEHFIITDGHYYGFQRLILDPKSKTLSSDGSWVHEKEREEVLNGIDWVMSERRRSTSSTSSGMSTPRSLSSVNLSQMR